VTETSVCQGTVPATVATRDNDRARLHPRAIRSVAARKGLVVDRDDGIGNEHRRSARIGDFAEDDDRELKFRSSSVAVSGQD